MHANEFAGYLRSYAGNPAFLAAFEVWNCALEHAAEHCVVDGDSARNIRHRIMDERIEVANHYKIPKPHEEDA